ncbi:hypothetical protein EOL70_13690 [Leucothrix sargassi]|nr:hypothetical protein EOL70_13690 [Leucothrix sargassi]
MTFISKKKQQGVVLLWALGILLVLTIVSVSSVKVSNLNTLVAGNSLSSMLVFQGAESTLSRVSNLNYVNEAATTMPSRSTNVAATELPDEAVSGGSLSAKASVSFVSYTACPAAAGIAMSTSSSAAAGGVTCQLFRVDAESRLKGTGAKKDHTMGIAVYVPPLNAAR